MEKYTVREYAFLVLYEIIVRNESPDDFEILFTETEEMLEQKIPAKSKKIVCQVFEQQESWNAIIENYSQKRRFNRIPLVNRVILQIAMAELQQGEQPVGVIISEAVTLSHKYASEEDSAFINGVLGTYVRDQEKKQ